MRIALVVYGSIHQVSGGYLYDRRLVETLASRGHEVEIVELPRRFYPLRFLDSVLPQLRRLPADFDLILEDELNHASLIGLNRRILRLHGRGTAGAERPRLVSVVHHLRCAEDHPPPLRRIYRAVESAYLGSVDGFLCNSRSTLASVAEIVPGPLRAAVAYPGGDRLSAGGEPARMTRGGPPRLLFVGNLIPRKGLHVLLAALGRLPRGSFSLVIAGSKDADPRYARRTVELAGRLGLAGTLFVGAPSDEELADLYAEADVLAVPSSYEGFGIVYLEAMRFGVVPIGTTAGGAAEIVSDGVDGFLAPPGGVSALAEVVARLAGDRGLLDRMSAAARAKARAFLGWDASMAAAAEFLEGIVGCGEASAAASNR